MKPQAADPVGLEVAGRGRYGVETNCHSGLRVCTLYPRLAEEIEEGCNLAAELKKSVDQWIQRSRRTKMVDYHANLKIVCNFFCVWFECRTRVPTGRSQRYYVINSYER